MSKQLTPMQELIEYIEEFTPKNRTTTGIWVKAKSLLQKEKQVIKDACEYGNDYNNPMIIDGEDYYNNKFKND